MDSQTMEGGKPKDVPEKTLGQVFEESTKRYENKIMQLDARTGKYDTFSEMGVKVKNLAWHMHKDGITSNDIIVLCAKTTLDTSLPVLATWYLGAKIAALDVTLSIRQNAHLLALVAPRLIFVDADTVELIEESLKSVNLTSKLIVFGHSEKYQMFDDYQNGTCENLEDFHAIVIDINETALITFSSGTTGLPKGICHSHYGFLHIAANIYNTGFDFSVMLSFSSFYWISSVMFFVLSFLKGYQRILCGNDVNITPTLQAIEKYQITFMFLSPFLAYKFIDNENSFDVSSIKVIFVSGGQFEATQLQGIFPNAVILNPYGQSEVGFVTIFDIDTFKKFGSVKTDSCGIPVTGLSIQVINSDTNELLPPHEIGEIQIKGDCLMNGYYKEKTFDKKTFLKSGDVGYYDNDGCLYFLSRKKEMFKYCSWHIVPAAIESVLCEHPAIAEAVVFGVATNGVEGELPAGCIILKKDHNLSEKEIDDFILEKLSDRERLRGGVVFLDELPRTPTGKVMRNMLQNNYISNQN